GGLLNEPLKRAILWCSNRLSIGQPLWKWWVGTAHRLFGGKVGSAHPTKTSPDSFSTSRLREVTRMLTRRQLLQSSGLGFGTLALAYLERAGASEEAALSLRPRPAHFPPRARAVIQLMQNGGPSQMDLFDPKPELQKRQGEEIPGGVETFQKGNTT